MPRLNYSSRNLLYRVKEGLQLKPDQFLLRAFLGGFLTHDFRYILSFSPLWLEILGRSSCLWSVTRFRPSLSAGYGRQGIDVFSKGMNHSNQSQGIFTKFKSSMTTLNKFWIPIKLATTAGKNLLMNQWWWRLPDGNGNGNGWNGISAVVVASAVATMTSAAEAAAGVVASAVVAVAVVAVAVVGLVVVAVGAVDTTVIIITNRTDLSPRQ